MIRKKRRDKTTSPLCHFGLCVVVNAAAVIHKHPTHKREHKLRNGPSKKKKLLYVSSFTLCQTFHFRKKDWLEQLLVSFIDNAEHHIGKDTLNRCKGLIAIVLQGLTVDTARGIIDYTNPYQASYQHHGQHFLGIKQQFTVLSLLENQGTISYLLVCGFFPLHNCVIKMAAELSGFCECIHSVWVGITHTVKT